MAVPEVTILRVGSMATHISNQFQLFKPEGLSYFEGVRFNDDQNQFFEERVRDLRDAFVLALDNGKYWDFVKAYVDSTLKMLARSRDKRLYIIFNDALWRLIVYLYHLRARSRSNFCETDSVFRFELDRAMLADARSQVDQLEAEGGKIRDYDLSRAPQLKLWVSEKLQPMIEEHIGYSVVSPGGELRYANSEIHMNEWKEIRLHRYSNFHYDQAFAAYPMAIYLDDVDETSGPFSYVDGSDKLQNDYVTRALHSALTFGCGVGGMTDDDFRVIGSLPSVFRGGDLVGAYAGMEVFQQSKIVEVTGPIGSGVLFNGFHLVHSGGKPLCGKRKSLFIYFRYPMHKIWQMFGRGAAQYWKYRTRNVLS